MSREQDDARNVTHVSHVGDEKWVERRIVAR